MSSEIAFTRDIIKEVSKNLNLEEAKVKCVYDSIMKYIKHLVTNTTTTAIFIPNIGTLYLKTFFTHKAIKNERRRKGVSLDIWKKRLEKIQLHVEKLKKLNHKYSRHSQKDSLYLKKMTEGKSIEEIEKLQNG